MLTIMTDIPDESNLQSFIVKIWVEEASEDKTQKSWRGYITHVASNKRSYVKSLDEITNYFQQYMALINQID